VLLSSLVTHFQNQAAEAAGLAAELMTSSLAPALPLALLLRATKVLKCLFHPL
jgi:hypothetical protein